MEEEVFSSNGFHVSMGLFGNTKSISFLLGKGKVANGDIICAVVFQ